MSLWGSSSSDESKPKNLTTTEKAEVFANEKGWVVRAGSARTGNGNASATPEVLVAIGGLATALAAATISSTEWDISEFDVSAGGTLSVTSEAVSTFTTPGISVDMAGTWTASDLQHFDNPASNELRHIGTDPKDFRVTFDFVIRGGSNDVITISMVKIDTLANVTVEYTQTRVINNLQGGRDVAYFNGTFNVRLNQNDLLIWQVANTTDTTNVTIELDSQWIVEER